MQIKYQKIDATPLINSDQNNLLFYNINIGSEKRWEQIECTIYMSDTVKILAEKITYLISKFLI